MTIQTPSQESAGCATARRAGVSTGGERRRDTSTAPRPRQRALDQGVEAADAVAQPGHPQAGPRQQGEEDLGVVHLAVAVGDAAEVERGLLQAEGRGLEALPIPEQLEDPEPPARRQGGAHLAQHGDDLRFGEAVEQLAHPDQLVAARQRRLRVEQVERMPAARARASRRLAAGARGRCRAGSAGRPGRPRTPAGARGTGARTCRCCSRRRAGAPAAPRRGESQTAGNAWSE